MSSKTLRNWKKALALLSAFALLFVYLPMGSVSKAATVEVYHETFAASNGVATPSGDVSLTTASGVVFEGNADGTALNVSNRSETWDAADFKFTDLGLENGKTYTITIKGYVAPGATVPSGSQAALQPVNPGTNQYGAWINAAAMAAGSAFTLTGTYTVDTATYDRLRILSNDTGKTVPFYVGDILITGDGTSTPPSIPVILYHRIVASPSNEWTDTSITNFKAHIDYLQQNGYTTLSADEYVNIMQGKATAPAKPILLTFDDATPDFVSTALPYLEGKSMKSVLFVISDDIGGGYSMSLAQLQDIADNHPSVSIESHSKTHDQTTWSTSISYATASAELTAAKTYINGITGKNPVLLAWPYGNSSTEARTAAADTGIQYAFKVGYPNDGAYNMGRHYSQDMTLTQFASAIGGPAPAAPSVYSNGFEGGSVTGFFQSGTATLSVSTEQKSGGAQSLKVVTTGNQSYDGAQIKASDAGVALGKKYHISAKVYAPDQPVQLIIQAPLTKTADGSTDWKWIANKTYTTSDTGWSTLEGDLDLTGSTYSAISNIQFVKGATTNITFYVDDFTVTDLSVATPLYSNDFEGGSVTGFFQSGTATLSVSTEQKSGGAQSLKVVTTGSQSYDGAQIKASDAGVALGKKYHISAKVYAPDQPVQLIIQAPLTKTADGSTDWKWIANKTYTTSDTGWSTLEGDLDLTGSTYSAISNIQFVKGATTNITFYVDDFTVTDLSGGDGGDIGETSPAAIFVPIDFEDQTKGGFVARGGVETVVVSAEANHTTGGAYSLKTTGRQQNWQGPSLDVAKYIDKGSKYRVTLWAKLITPSSVELDLSTQLGSSSYPNITKKQVSVSDGWVKITGDYTYSDVPEGKATIYLQSSTVSAEYYIDDVSFEKVGSAPTTIENDLTAIKDVYTNDFLIGTAILPTDLSGLRFDLLKKHFNVATAGNAMKPESLEKAKGTWTWTEADNMVQKVLDAGLQMHGHVLVWHSQSPAWLNMQVDGSGNSLKDGSGNIQYLTREEALTNMRDYITTVVNHFGNKVISWDVVNEAMSDNPSNPTDWKAALRKSPWYYAIGDDYVEQAFLIAREAIDADPALQGIKLYYNDYNEDNQNKATAIYSMVKELNEKYASTHPGKTLIDGVGMQAHYNMSTNPDNVKASLEKFVSLPGVEVSITELDITSGSTGSLTEEQAKAQGYLYAQLFKLYKEHADKITRVTIWGMDDGESWRKEGSPLPFDANLQHKPAYDAIIDPVTYMAENPPPALPDAKQGTAKYGTPVIDGTVDSAWSNVPAMDINQYLQATNGASGTVRAMWDDSNLYLLYQVNNAVLDKSSTNAWEQDSVEAFVDENNRKTPSYESDDGQYRVNYANETSFNPSSISAGFESATTTGAGANYTVEMKIPFKTITPAENTKIGFDSQINDGEAGSRISAATWNDAKGVGYQDTSVYGVLTLTGKETGTTPPVTPPVTTPGDQPTISTGTSQDGKSVNATAVITPTAPDSNGEVKANVDAGTLNNLAATAKDAETKGQTAVVVIKVNTPAAASEVNIDLPKDALVKLAQDTKTSVKVDAGMASITFDAKAMDSLSGQLTGANVNLNVSKVDSASLPQDVKAKVGDRPVFDISLTSGNTAITNFGGGKLQIAFPYTLGFGENKNAIIVNYIGSDGKLNTVRGRYDEATGTVICVTTHLSKYAVSYNNVTFKDVSAGSWYKNAVAFIGSRGISDGIGGGKFGPDKNLTRAEFLVMLMRAYQIAPDANPSANFADAGNTYYTGYLAAAKRLGISEGVGGDRFASNRIVTRQEMFTLLYNALKSINELPAAKAGKSFTSFSDSGKVANWANEAMKHLTEAGIITGDNGRLNPSGTAKRSDSAQTLYNLLNG